MNVHFVSASVTVMGRGIALRIELYQCAIDCDFTFSLFNSLNINSNITISAAASIEPIIIRNNAMLLVLW